LVPSGSAALSEWGGAADRGLKARQERQNIISRVLKDGPDFGTIPGTPKPTLLKPGAEKIADCLNLYPDYEPIQVIEDFDKPLFFYRYRCILRQRGSDAVIATGIGSCNSMEDRYRWRKAERVCPSCGKAAIIKGKAEYGGGFLCFKKKDGCGAKFKEDDQGIVSQEVGKAPNPDLHSQVNTIDKMAQKRALVAAALNLGFSEQFTQDLEDTPEEEREIPATVTKTEPPKGKPDEPINEKDRRMMWGRWQERAKALEIPENESETRFKAILLRYGYDSTKKVCNGDLGKILEAIEAYEVPDAA
jgi:hypothetical protein